MSCFSFITTCCLTSLFTKSEATLPVNEGLVCSLTGCGCVCVVERISWCLAVCCHGTYSCCSLQCDVMGASMSALVVVPHCLGAHSNELPAA